MLKINGTVSISARRVASTGTGKVMITLDHDDLAEAVKLLEGCTRIEAENLDGVDVYAAESDRPARIVSISRNLENGWMTVSLDGLTCTKGAGT